MVSRFVIAGLDPAIHGEPRFNMDHRVKPGGDDGAQLPHFEGRMT